MVEMLLVCGITLVLLLSMNLTFGLLQAFVLPRFRLARGLMGQGQFGFSFLTSCFLKVSWEGGRIQNLSLLSIALASIWLGCHLLVSFWLGFVAWSDVSLYLPICLGLGLVSLQVELVQRLGREHSSVKELAISSIFFLILITLLLRLDLRQPETWIGHTLDIMAHAMGFLLLVFHSGLLMHGRSNLRFPSILSGSIEVLRALCLASIFLTKAWAGSLSIFLIFALLAFLIGVALNSYEILSYRLKTQDKEHLLSEKSFSWITATAFLVILGSAT